MESKWYFFPGQTPTNTKISDRAHALHMTSTCWNQITKHLDRKRLIQEALAKEKAHKKALKDGSEAMTKQWPNSIENLRIKKDKERQDEIERVKREKLESFYKLKRENEAERKKFVEQKKKAIFTSSGYAKQLSSALLLSETLHEREKQLEFNKKLKQHEREVEQAFNEKVLQDVEADRREKEEKRVQQMEKAKAYGDVLKKQIEENESALRASETKRAQKEIVDYANAEQEEKLIQDVYRNEKIRKRRQMLLDQRNQIEQERQREKILKQEEKELEQAVELYASTRQHINCLMVTNEKEMRKELIRKREELVAKVAAVAQEKDKEENIRLNAAIAEINAKELAREQAKQAALERAKQDRIDDRKQLLDRMENEAKLENELKKWEMLNRIKTNEEIEEHNAKMLKEAQENKMRYGTELKKQIAENLDADKHDKLLDDEMSRLDFSEQDQMFFDYAKEVEDLAQKKNRTLYPIQRVTETYKKVNSLVPNDRNARRCCNYKNK